MTLSRHYYRCRSCCHVVATETMLETKRLDNGAAEIVARCVCDGKLELLGRVSRARRGLVLDSERCACDARCTNANGPSCDCVCGGVNHGTHRVVPIEIGAGGVPRLVVADEAACLARAAEYANAMAPHRAELRAMRDARAGSVRRPSWNEDALATALGKISALRTHKCRLAAIAKL